MPVPLAVARFSYWPGSAVPAGAVQVIEASTARVAEGQVTGTPWSSVTATFVSGSSLVLVTT